MMSLDHKSKKTESRIAQPKTIQCKRSADHGVRNGAELRFAFIRRFRVTANVVLEGKLVFAGVVPSSCRAREVF